MIYSDPIEVFACVENFGRDAQVDMEASGPGEVIGVSFITESVSVGRKCLGPRASLHAPRNLWDQFLNFTHYFVFVSTVVGTQLSQAPITANMAVEGEIGSCRHNLVVMRSATLDDEKLRVTSQSHVEDLELHVRSIDLREVLSVDHGRLEDWGTAVYLKDDSF
jgi:hypothetical protein